MNTPIQISPREVIKRSGERGPPSMPARSRTLQRAGAATGEFDGDEGALLAAQVRKVLMFRFHGQAPHIEQIQDVVEQTLIAANHLKTARAYIVYREKHATLRRDRQTLVDVNASVSEYLSRSDWRVNANANPGLFAGRPDPQRGRQGDGQLLAVARVHARDRRRAPQRRPAHPRPGHAVRLLRRLVAAHAAARSVRTACPARWRRGRPGTCRPRSARWSTSWARCRTSGRARRPSPPSTPTWRPSSARTA